MTSRSPVRPALALAPLLSLALGLTACAGGSPENVAEGPSSAAPEAPSAALTVTLPVAPSASPSTSASAAPRVSGAATPEAAWRGLLAAMRDGSAIEPWATSRGVASLEAGARGEPTKTAYARWGKGWQAWEVRWTTRDADAAHANLGPEVKEHGLDFVRTPDGWKLDRWQPGE